MHPKSLLLLLLLRTSVILSPCTRELYIYIYPMYYVYTLYMYTPCSPVNPEGPYIKWFLEKLGHDGLNRMLGERAASQDRVYVFSIDACRCALHVYVPLKASLNLTLSTVPGQLQLLLCTHSGIRGQECVRSVYICLQSGCVVGSSGSTGA